MLMLPTLRGHPRVTLVAACDPRDEARAVFMRDFQGRAYAQAEALCGDPEVDAVYVASPHQYHAEHVILAARHGKHVLVEKPMALTLAECDAMIAAARHAGITLVVGHSHSFDAPYRMTRDIIDSGAHGGVRMITAINFTDYLYRPRRPEELATAQGGGVVFNQAAHHADVVRFLAGSPLRSVRALTGAWDAARAVPAAYTAHLTFANGAFATMTYNGYGRYDSDELMGDIGENGLRKDDFYGASWAPMRRVTDAAAEHAIKTARTYGHAREEARPPTAHHHFGFVMVSCDRADLRPLPTGVVVYDGSGRALHALPAPRIPRSEVIDELCDAIAGVRPAFHSGEWARGTLAACLAMDESARTGREVLLQAAP